jgi:hypothetical protein
MNIVEQYKPVKKLSEIKENDVLTILNYTEIGKELEELYSIRSKVTVLAVEECTMRCTNCPTKYIGIHIKCENSNRISDIACVYIVGDEFGRKIIID